LGAPEAAAAYGVGEAAEAEAEAYEVAEAAAAVYAVAEVAAAVYAVAAAAAAAAVYAVAGAAAAAYAVAGAAAAAYAVAGAAAAAYAVAEVAVGAEGVGAARHAAAFWGRESAGSANASQALPPYPARRPVRLRPCFLKRRPPGGLAGSTSCFRRCRPPSADCLWRLRQSR
jgi:hypothetical protein